MQRKCSWWRGHNWGDWKVVNEYNMLRKYKKDEKWLKIGFLTIQERYCKDCNFKQTNKEEIKVYD